MSFLSRAMKGWPITANTSHLLTPQQADENSGCPIVTAVAHSFTVGQILKRATASTYGLASADAEANMLDLSICVADLDADTYQILRRNNAQDVAWTHGTGGSFGDPFYLSSATPGGVVLTPESGFEVPLGYIVSATVVHWEPGLIS